jgi:hypothetical protein
MKVNYLNLNLFIVFNIVVLLCCCNSKPKMVSSLRVLSWDNLEVADEHWNVAIGVAFTPQGVETTPLLFERARVGETSLAKNIVIRDTVFLSHNEVIPVRKSWQEVWLLSGNDPNFQIIKTPRHYTEIITERLNEDSIILKSHESRDKVQEVLKSFLTQ